MEKRFVDSVVSKNSSSKVIYKKKDSQVISQQAKMVRASFQHLQNSYHKDLKTASDHRQIIQQIIGSKVEQREASPAPTSKGGKNYFPVQSLTSHGLVSSDPPEQSMISNSQGGFFRVKSGFAEYEGTPNSKGKVISRSVPRSPMKQRERSQEIQVYRRDQKTGQLVKSGKRVLNNEETGKRGK
jgi:hypothetical protein